MTVTKKDVCMMIYAEIGLPQVEGARIADSLFEIIKDELALGNQVMISRFGNWDVLNKKSRNGRNPKTGEPMQIDAREVVTFRPSHVLKAEINPGE